jgi:hypothetical protein
MYAIVKNFTLEAIKRNFNYNDTLSIFANELFVEDCTSELYKYINREDMIKNGY